MTKVDRRDFMYLKKVVCFRMKPFEQFKKVPYNSKKICIDQSEYGCNAIVNSIFLPLFKNILVQYVVIQTHLRMIKTKQL